MERNVDKIKRLEKELGRWQKKVRDQRKELERLRQAEEDARQAVLGTGRLLDGILTALALHLGERAEGPGHRGGAGLAADRAGVRPGGDGREVRGPGQTGQRRRVRGRGPGEIRQAMRRQGRVLCLLFSSTGVPAGGCW